MRELQEASSRKSAPAAVARRSFPRSNWVCIASALSIAKRCIRVNPEKWPKPNRTLEM